MFSDFKDSFPQVTIASISQIPIPNNNQPLQDQITMKVNQILTVKASNSTANTSALEAEIDRLVYELYGLTDAEIAIVEGRA